MLNVEEFKKISNIIELSKIKELLRRGLRVERIGNWIWVTGHTLNSKELLKEYGFKWNKSKFAWFYHKGNYYKKSQKDYTLEELRKAFE